MYIHLCGNEDRVAWLGPEHSQMSVLTNVTTEVPIEVTNSQHARLLNLRECGVNAMDRAGVRFLPELRNSASASILAAAQAKKKDPLEYFKDKALSMKSKSRTMNKRKQTKKHRAEAVTSAWRNRSMEISRIANDALKGNLSIDERKMWIERMNTLEKCKNIMTPFADAFRNPENDQPKEPKKSRFWSLLENELKTDHLRPFVVHGVPNLRPQTQLDGNFTDHFPEYPRITAAVDLMNILHVPPDAAETFTVRTHAMKCASVIRGPLMMAGDQLLRLEAHVDYAPYVVTQKNATKRKRDLCRMQNGQNNDRIQFDFDGPLPRNWNAALSDRQYKERFTGAVCAQTLIEGASVLRKMRSSASVLVAGARIAVSQSAASVDDPQVLRVCIIENGVAVVHVVDEDLDRFSELLYNADWVWRVQNVLQDNEQSHVTKITKVESMSAAHGEAETRMQYTTFSFPFVGTRNSENDNRVILQYSQDSDNVCLALLSHCDERVVLPRNTFVLMNGKHYDIENLKAKIDASGVSCRAIARLYCISGNDFNHACQVATSSVLISAYLQWYSRIGELDSPESVAMLFYVSFLSTVVSAEQMKCFMLADDLFSERWKSAARETICTSKSTVSTSRVLPQDEDIALVYRRAVLFNVSLYWGRTLQPRLIDIPCDIETGYTPDGYIILEEEQHVQARKSLLAKVNARCNCGKGSSVECCLSSKSLCSCVKAKKKCTAQCGCPSSKCKNPEAGRPLQLDPSVGISGSRSHQSDRRRSEAISIKRLVNEHDDSERDQTPDGSDTDSHITSDNDSEIEHSVKIRSVLRTGQYTDDDTDSEKELIKE